MHIEHFEFTNLSSVVGPSDKHCADTFKTRPMHVLLTVCYANKKITHWLQKRETIELSV